MNKHWDIIVVGGGFAGVGAAISAAREDKKVLLIEKFNCLGGAACYDLVNPFMKYWTTVDDNARNNLSEGIFSEIIMRLKSSGAMQDNSTRFNEEYLKIILNSMAVENNVELLFNTVVTSVKVSDGRLSSVTVSNVSGCEELEADYFIDCTGDANLSYLSGFQYKVGRPEDGLCQPMTLCFRMADVDSEKFSRTDINDLYIKLHAEGKFKNPRENVLMFRTLVDSIIHFNTTRVIRLDPTNAWDVTKAEIEAREQIQEMVEFLKENFDAFRNSQLISSGMQIGARESRMIEGLHVLSRDEIVACTKFDDGIAACNYDIDIHNPDGSGTYIYSFAEGTYYTIPYRCLVPKTSRNLLVAGRCISCDHETQASMRIMPVCCTLGEAAGTASAILADTGSDVNDIDTALLRNKLRDYGCVVD